MPDKEVPKEQSDFKYIVRLSNTDLEGEKAVIQALTNIKGVGARIANIIVQEAEVSPIEKIGNLKDEEIEELQAVLDEVDEIAPDWFLNRQKDRYTGDDLHILGNELKSQLMDDINEMRKIRCYRGIRHETGRKVRGQRTKSNGRKGSTMGVQKRKVMDGGK